MLTIGHSTLSIELFLGILQHQDCRRLIDIRTVPRSRYNPQFEQSALAASLGSVQIGYHWMRSLGGLRRPDKDSINYGWRNPSFRGYADYMQTAEFSRAIQELLTFSGERTVLMCAEAVPWRCHRSLVGDALLARQVPVEDIFYDAKGNSHRKPHSFTAFARVDGKRVWYPAENDLLTVAAQES